MSSPAHLSTSVGVGASIVLEFSEAIDPATLEVTSTPESTNLDAVLSNNNSTATLKPQNDRQPNTQYTVTVSAKDLAGNSLASSPISPFEFTTGANPDTTAPTITSISPTNNAMNVSVSGLSVTLTFSEPIKPGSIQMQVNQGGFELGVATFVMPNVVRWSSPPEPFEPNTTYSMQVSALDLANNALTGTGTFTFRTGAPADSSPPRVAYTLPTLDRQAVPRNTSVVVAFSEPMKRASVEGTFRINGVSLAGSFAWSADDMFVRFTPTVVFGVGTQVITMTGATDPANNVLTPYTSNFTTTAAVDSVAPTLVGSTPAAGDLAYPVFVCLTRAPTRVILQFSEPMDIVGTAPALVVESSAGAAIAGRWLWSSHGQTVYFIPTVPFSYNTSYRVRINTPSTAAKDLASNPLSTMSSVFRTLKTVTYTVPMVPAETGRILSAPVAGQSQLLTNTAVRVGEFSHTVQMRGYYGFAVAATVPANAHCIPRAELTLNQLGVTGAPYPALGQVKLELVNIGGLFEAADYDAGVVNIPSVTVTDSATDTASTVDVTLFARSMHTYSVPQALRLRLSFTTETAANATVDATTFETSSASPVFKVTAEVP